MEVGPAPEERWLPKDRGCLHWEAQDFTGRRRSNFLGHPGRLPGEGVLRAGPRGKLRLDSGLMVRAHGQDCRSGVHEEDNSIQRTHLEQSMRHA